VSAPRWPHPHAGSGQYRRDPDAWWARALVLGTLLSTLLSTVSCRDLLGVDDLHFDERIADSGTPSASNPGASPTSIDASTTENVDGGQQPPTDPNGFATTTSNPPGPRSTAPDGALDGPDGGAGSDDGGGSPFAPMPTVANGSPTTGAPINPSPSPTTSASPPPTTDQTGPSATDGNGGSGGSEPVASTPATSSTGSGGASTGEGGAGGDSTGTGGEGGNVDPNPQPDAGPGQTCELAVDTLDEDFSDAAQFNNDLGAGCWGTFNTNLLGYVDVDESDSVLRALPNAGSGWYQTSTGPLFYRAVTGNFVAETIVVTSLSTDRSLPPGARWSGGGLLAYDPSSTLGVDDIYYLVGTGRLEGSDTGVKSEATQSAQTLQDLDTTMSHSNRLRLCRIGNRLYTLYAPLGTENWQSFSYDMSLGSLPELPQRVYVGISAFQYPAGGAAVTQVEFERFIIRTGVQSFADCAAPLP